MATWGESTLVRLPGEINAPGTASPEAVAFLRAAGLPEGIVYGDPDGPAHLSFARLARGLTPISRALPAGFSVPATWSSLVVIGEEWFEGGAAPWWCLHGPSGRVEVVDLESEDAAPRLVNTSVAHLAKTLLAFRRWAEGGRASGVSGLRTELRDSDPAAFDMSRWSDLVEHLDEIGSVGVAFEVRFVPPGRRQGS